MTVDGDLECGVIFDSELTANIIVGLLNKLMEEKEHYRRCVLEYLKNYDRYSDELLGLFNGLNDIPQLIIVTHNPHSEVLADNVVRVCKRNGVSILME